MAKKNVASAEERLAAALVPAEEQPYQVPENWVWTTVGIINKYEAKSYDPSATPEAVFELYSVPSSANDYPEIISGADIGSTKQIVRKGDVLLCKINPRINRVWKVTQHTDHVLLASSEWIVIRNDMTCSEYLMLCFRSQYFRDYMLSNVSGVGGSLMRAQPKHVLTYPVPLPPLAEQHRIVDRITSLFAQLDEAQEEAQAVIDGYEDRKAAILHRAFTGELTEDWRSNNQLYIENWEKTNLGERIILLSGQDFKPEMYNSNKNGLPYITGASNFGDAHIIINRWTTVPSVISNKGDVLLVCKGSGYGKTIIADYDSAHIARQIMALRVKKSIINRFVLYFLQAEYAYLKTSGQGLIPGISRSVVLNMSITVPSISEQREIVRRLDKLLENEAAVKSAAEDTIAQIDALRQSILARAFRGELGTNDPTDEPAVELLKRTLKG